MTEYAIIDGSNIIKNIIYFDDDENNIDVFLDAQKIIISDENAQAIKIEPHHKFTFIGAKYNDEQFEIIQPYPSWKWDSLIEQWIAPEPHPYEIYGNDSIEYIWNEEEQKWLPR